MTDQLVQYGLAGVCIIGLAWFVLYLMKQHKEERESWTKRQEQQNDDHNRSLNKNTEVLSELTTLIKSMRK